MNDLKQRVFAVPAAFKALGRFFWFIAQADDPYWLIYHTSQGDIDRAFETVDMTDEEIRDTINKIRDDAEIVGEEVPEIREASQDELVGR